MNGFVLVPKELSKIDSKNRYLDIAVYYVIRFVESNYVSRISLDKICKKLHITKRDAIKAVRELKELKILDYIQIPSEVNDYKFNEYHFNKELDKRFEKIGKDLLTENLKAKQIGLLIYLKLISEFGWLRFKNITEFANIVGVTRQTASKYIKDLSTYIELSKVNGLHFINNIFTFKDIQTKNTNTIKL